MLEQLFGSKTRIKVLRFLFSHPEKAFFVREICRMTQQQLNAVRRELANLLELKILVEQEKDRKRFYQVNKGFVLHDELKGLVLKSQILLEEDLINKVSKLGSIQLFVLCGIFTDVKDARTDLLLVGNINKKELNKILDKFQEEIDRPIRYTIFSTKEYQDRQEIGDRFLFEIFSGRNVKVIDKLIAQQSSIINNL